MGLLVEGQWRDVWYDTKKSGGRFLRSQAQFRNWITPDGSKGPTGEAGFAAKAGRYHLYASYACPWVHRVLIYRVLKGLEEMIDVSFVHWLMADKGWTFSPDKEGIVGDHLFGMDYAYEIYQKADPRYSGRVTVPILWDKQQQTIVSNESSEIIRMLNSAFDECEAKQGDYYPVAQRAEIDALNERIYGDVNNGVYKAGFATTQEAYEEAVEPLFETLDWLDKKLANRRFLLGDTPLEADWRLLPTLLRFDPIYVSHFKCSKKRIADYPNLWRYLHVLVQWEGIARTINMTHARKHYFMSHGSINPSAIVPLAPELQVGT